MAQWGGSKTVYLRAPLPVPELEALKLLPADAPTTIELAFRNTKDCLWYTDEKTALKIQLMDCVLMPEFVVSKTSSLPASLMPSRGHFTGQHLLQLRCTKNSTSQSSPQYSLPVSAKLVRCSFYVVYAHCIVQGVPFACAFFLSKSTNTGKLNQQAMPDASINKLAICVAGQV